MLVEYQGRVAVAAAVRGIRVIAAVFTGGTRSWQIMICDEGFRLCRSTACRRGRGLSEWRGLRCMVTPLMLQEFGDEEGER